ncbi:CapA family protein [Candidatus Nomurabacteria bacterium]|nr:CapA family protein [Candidatus Nomurabacteria bacterium]
MSPSLKSKIKSGFWGVFSVVVGVSFTFLIFQNLDSKIPQTQNISLGATAIESNITKETPKYYFAKNGKEKPKVSAQAYVVGDLSTGKIILAKNQNKKFPIASVSKLITATVLSEIAEPEDLIQVSKKALETEGVNGNLHINEKIKASDIYYPLLLESSNDAAEVIAEYPGRENFIEKMNDKVKDLGLASTFFKDPSGLSPGNQSTPFDLFKFTQYLKREKPELLKITTNRSYNNKKHTWFSNNQFLREEGYEGGKSGYTDEALQTGISVFSIPLGEDDPHSIAILLLQSNDRLKDVENILKYLKKNIYYGEEKNANIAWIKQGTTEAEVKEISSVTLSFAGDIMLARGVKSSVMKNFNGDYSALFEKLDILQKSDIVFANLEGTASDKGHDLGNLYSFRMDPSVVPALRGAGIDVLSMANNHVGDWGREAYVDTLARLKENEILYTGGGMNESEAEQPVIIEKQGIRIGFLAFSDKGPDYLKADADRAGLLLANNPRFDEIIQNASSLVDFLVVSFHFGEEYQTKHDKRQEDLAHRAIDNGAKIIVGHHPHVIQDTEVYKNGYIIYSLGNFIFDQAFSKETMEGMLVGIKLKENGEMSVKKDIVKLNRVFQPDSIIKGKEEKIKFPDPETTD